MQNTREYSHRSPQSSPVYLLWDESHFWGVMLWRALRYLQIPFATCRSSEIKQGILAAAPAEVLLVPGGFASAKARSLGESGCREISRFVENKGVYLGFCGGAGLALNNYPWPGLELCHWTRKAAAQRLPNCSGHINVHPGPCASSIPQTLNPPLSVPIWWPSQFEPAKNSGIDILATYKEPDTDFWVGDIPLNSTNRELISNWEDLYNINLDPELLRDEPCMISGSFGQGSFLLSYLHLETPNSFAANLWLYNLLRDRGATETGPGNGPDRIAPEQCLIPEWDLKSIPQSWKDPYLLQAFNILLQLIRIGEENFLFCWRKPWLLGWRRGIPGFALNSLLSMLHQVMEIEPGEEAHKYWRENRDLFLDMLKRFEFLYQRYMIQKRLQLARDTRSSSQDPTSEMQDIKRQLTGSSKQEENLYKGITTVLQELVWLQISSMECE
ncbi:MAG: BPL-N domain-containing protein [Thermodesulfobacteriota bacterium]